MNEKGGEPMPAELEANELLYSPVNIPATVEVIFALEINDKLPRLFTVDVSCAVEIYPAVPNPATVDARIDAFDASSPV
jgi:hypothetical protein